MVAAISANCYVEFPPIPSSLSFPYWYFWFWFLDTSPHRPWTAFYCCDKQHAKSSLGKKIFICLTCHDHSLTLREVRAEPWAGAEAGVVKGCWLLHCPHGFLRLLSYIPQDRLPSGGIAHTGQSIAPTPAINYLSRKCPRQVHRHI